MEIGTGEDEFVELADHAPLTMVHGPQGGWHMLASVRVSGTQPEVHIQYEIIHPESGVRVSDNSYNLALRMEDACVGSYVGMYGYLSVQALVEGELDTPPEILDGDSLILRMEVQDVDFNQAAAEAPVTAVRDAVDL